VDEAAEEALRTRIRTQGWDQGCALTARTDLFLADLRSPITAEAEATAAKEGAKARGVVNFDHEPSPGMIVVSQRCDLVAALDDEPLCEAIPLIYIPVGENLPGPNSARRFLIDHDKRLVADQSRRLGFEKALLPDRDAQQLLTSSPMKQSFRAWCARRASRIPLPDDFNETVGVALSRALESGLGKRPELEATFSWRVLQAEVDEDNVEVALLVPYDETHPAAADVPIWVAEIAERIRERLPKAHERASARLPVVRTHTLVGAEAKASNEISMRTLIDFPSFTLEHLTYRGEEVRGAEPHEEEVG
jgi:hypothetical protein